MEGRTVSVAPSIRKVTRETFCTCHFTGNEFVLPSPAATAAMTLEVRPTRIKSGAFSRVCIVDAGGSVNLLKSPRAAGACQIDSAGVDGAAVGLAA